MAQYSVTDLRTSPYPVDQIGAMQWHMANKVVSGGVVVNDATAASAHTATSHTFSIDMTACVAVVAGAKATVAALDGDVISTSTTADAAFTVALPTIICAVVIKNVAGALSVDYLLSDPQATATAVRPTTAEIDAEVGSKDWILIATIAFTWTAATTMTTTVTAQDPVYDQQPAL